MYKNLFLLLVLSATMLGCKSHQDGTYVVYEISDQNLHFQGLPYTTYTDSQIDLILKSYFQSKRYSVHFEENFVSLKPVQPGTELILSKSKDHEPHGYSQRLYKGAMSMNLYLTKDDDGSLLMGVSLNCPINDNAFLPVQLGPAQKSGFIICHLAREGSK